MLNYQEIKELMESSFQESQLNEVLGFGSEDHKNAMRYHKTKFEELDHLVKHHLAVGDHKAAAAYSSAATNHKYAMLLHDQAAEEAGNSVIKRASSKTKDAAKRASEAANSSKTPPPTETAKAHALSDTLRRHDRKGVPFTPRMDALFNGAKPTKDDFAEHLGPHWNDHG